MTRDTPEALRARAAALERQEREQTREIRSERMMNQFGKWIVAGVMLMFFVGVALGVYAVIFLSADLGVVLGYIQTLAAVAFGGYFLKAGFEKVALAPLQRAYGKLTGQDGAAADDEGEGI
jgi:predicted PurR-regulated permease PerM